MISEEDISLSTEALEHIKLWCVWENKTFSEVVSELIHYGVAYRINEEWGDRPD